MDQEKQARIVKAIWEVIEREGVCDGFGGSEYRRCESIVFDFVQAVYKKCNDGPV